MTSMLKLQLLGASAAKEREAKKPDFRIIVLVGIPSDRPASSLNSLSKIMNPTRAFCSGDPQKAQLLYKRGMDQGSPMTAS